MSDENIHQPKCGDCHVVGLEYIVEQESVQTSKAGDAWFNIVHCSKCGHVYGVFNKISLSPTPLRPIPVNPF